MEANNTAYFQFAEQVQRTPDVVAVEFEGQSYTYTELNQRANRLAHLLRQQGAGPEVLIGLYMERSLELVACLLGIWKAGAAYVPIDPDYPQERISYILADSTPLLLVTTSQLAAQLAGTDVPCFCVDEAEQQLVEQSDENPEHLADGAHLAYLIYTSGSTGLPKACMVEHRNLVSTLTATRERIGFRTGDVFGWFASVAFDSSLLELMSALLVGGTSVVLTRERVLDVERLVDELQRFTTFMAVPGLMRQIVWTIQERRLAPQLFARVRHVLTGGDAVPPEMLEALKAIFLQADIHVLYGPTETAILCTAYLVPRDQTIDKMNIGTAIRNCELRVYDDAGRMVAAGEPGELYIGGPCVARGYYRRAELTQEKFVQIDDMRWYRSGDLVRYLPEGTLEFLGRIDNQVKIRGVRIELGEIESLLTQHETVKGAVVVARTERSGDKRLAAYAVPATGCAINVSELRQYLQAKLPAYMVPSYLIVLTEFPLSPNDKIDRKALPAPDPTRDRLASEYVAPRTPLEQRLAAIWSEVLQVETVGVRDPFLELGGHSLLGTQIVSRMRKAFQVAVPLNVLFEAATVETLAQILQELQQAQAEESAIPAVSRDQKLPLSFHQQRLWFLDQMEPGSALYNLPSAFRLQGDLHVSALEKALSEIVSRHEALRTTFAAENGQPYQVIGAASPLVLPLVQVSGAELADRERQALELALAEAQQAFDLQRGPLLRAKLVQLAEQDHLLILHVHHIVSDGWSAGVLRRELAALYEAFVQGDATQWPELPVQYADFAVWHRDFVQAHVLAQQLAYWKQRLDGPLPVLQLPTDSPRPAKQSYRGATKRFIVPERVTGRLKGLCQQEGVTLYMALLAAFQTLLYRYSGQEDLLVGAPIANRQRSELEGMIGFFVNTLVMRTDLSGAPTFLELLQRVRAVALGAFAHQDLPFEKLVAELQQDRDLSYAALTPVVFSFENFDGSPWQLPGLTMTPVELDNGTAKFDLTLFMGEAGEELYARLEYNTDLFAAQTIERLQESFLTLLEGIVADPEQRIGQLPVLSPQQRQQLLVEWNDTATDYLGGHVSLAQLFEAQAERWPEQVAVVFGEQRLTYRELNGQANRLARCLREQGVVAQQLIGLSMERSVELIVALLAIVKIGAAYVPLDPAYPEERLRFMLEDAGVEVLLTQAHLAAMLPVQQAQVICLDHELAGLSEQRADNLPAAETLDEVLYVMYTSGSTGRPKGVGVTQRGVARLVKATNYADFSADDVFLHVAPISFDASTFEIWGSLLNGARLIVAPAGKLSLEELGRVIVSQQINTVFLTAGVFHQMLEGHLEYFQQVRRLFSGGDVLSPVLVKKALTQLAGCMVFNAYGPTENAAFTTCYPMRDTRQVGMSVPIGRPVANTQVYVLDAQMQPVPIGVPGELYTGGDGLAHGYLHRPDWTEEKFVPNPFSTQPGAKLYRTGDLVRYRADGNLEFLGRIDNQVKIRGFRIELGEIEAELRKQEAVREVLVIAREDVPGDKRLVAYVALEQPGAVNRGDLRQYLKGKLPEHMLPNAFVLLDALPLTINGKVDRKALPKPEQDLVEAAATYVAPRNAEETQVVQLWAELLGVERVGIHDNFFELGGHSLLATRLISRLSQTFQVDVPLQALFAAPTVAELLAQIKQGKPIAPQKEKPAMSAISRAAYRQKATAVSNDLDN